MTVNEYLLLNDIDCNLNFKLDISVKPLLLNKNLLFKCKHDGRIFKDLRLAEYYVHSSKYNNNFFTSLVDIYNQIEILDRTKYIRNKKLNEIFKH